MTDSSDEHFMHLALGLAKDAAERSEVPVGAVLVLDGEVIGEGANSTIHCCDPTGHAEIMALRMAATHQGNYRLPDSTLYVTIEPCAMCLGAIVQARVGRVVFGATEPKAGVLASNPSLLDAGFFNHRFETTGGVLAHECSEIMSSFFRERRELKARLKNLSPTVL